MSQGRLGAYQQVAQRAQTPAGALDEVFERTIVECGRAVGCMRIRDITGKSAALNRVVELLGELQASLDHAVAPELCAQLYRLYGRLEVQIFHANWKMDPEIVRKVAAELGAVRLAFSDAAKMGPIGRAPAAVRGVSPS